MKIRALFASILGLVFATSVYAQTAPSVAAYSVANIATVKANNLGSKLKITVESYSNIGDGGKAEYTLAATDCGTDLPGACLHDGANNAFVRSDWSNSLAPFGIAKGGHLDFDAHSSSPNDATPTIIAALAVLQPKGFNVGHLKGVSVYLGTSPMLADYQGIDCDVTSIGPYDTGHYYGHPGTLYTEHGVTPTTSDGTNDQQSIQHCIMTPYWSVHPASVSAFSGFTFNYPATSFTDLEAMLGNMIKAGDTGIYFNGARNGRLEELGIYGYDTAIHLKNPNESHISQVRTDANVSVFTEGGGSSTEFSNVHSQNYFTKQVDDTNGVNIPSSENWTITSIGQGAVNSFGTHECRLTITGGVYNNGSTAPTSDVQTSAVAANGVIYTFGAFMANLTINDIGNGVACKGTGQFGITKISDDGTNAVVDLNGSQLGTGSDIITGTATWDATQGCTAIPTPCTIINLKSGDTNSIQEGEAFAGADIPSGAHIVGVCNTCKGKDPYDGAIAQYIIDRTATASHLTPVSVTFDGGAYVYQGPATTKGNPAFSLDVTQRFFAGQSPGGLFTQTMPSNNGIPKAAGIASYGTVGIKADKMQEFAHHDGYAVNDSNGLSVVQQGSDDGNKAEDDNDTIGVNLIGSTNKATLQGALSGAGLGLNVDLASVSQTSSNATTVNSGGGVGLVTLTTSSSMSSWAKDTDGTLTLTACPTASVSGGICPDPENSSTTERVTAMITGSTTVKLLDRGQFGTNIQAIGSGWTIIQSTVSGTSGVIDVGPGGLNSLGDAAIGFVLNHGSVAMDRVIVRGGGKAGFISSNFTQSVFTGTLFKDMTIYYDGVAAYSSSRGCGNQWAIPYAWECLGGIGHFDASQYGFVGDNTTDNSPQMAALLAAANTGGQKTAYVSLNGQYYFATGISVPSGMTVQCLSSRMDQLENSSGVPTGDHKTIPYTFLIPSSATVTLGTSGGTSATMSGCTVENKAVYDTPNPTTLQSMYNITGNGTNAGAVGGTGVTCGGDGCKFEKGNILGFTNGFVDNGHSTPQLNEAYIDSTNCVDIVQSTFIKGNALNFGCYSLLTNRLTNGLQALPISAIAASPSTPANYRFTLSSPCNPATGNCPVTGNAVWVGLPSNFNQPVGVESAAGQCTFVYIDNSNFECSNSQATATVTTGNPVANSTRICSIATLTHVRKAQQVSGTGIPGSDTVVSVAPREGCVWLAAAATAGGTGVALTFTDNAYSGSDLYNLRPFANFRFGAGVTADNEGAMAWANCEVYTHTPMFLITNGADGNTFTNCGMHDESIDLDSSHVGIDFENNAKGNLFVGGTIDVGGNQATAILDNTQLSQTLTPNKVIVPEVGQAPQANIFLDNVTGSLIADLAVGTTSGDIFIGDASRTVVINNFYGPNVAIHTQSSIAESKLIGCNTVDSSGSVYCNPETTTATLTAFSGGGQTNATLTSTDIVRVNGVAANGDSVMLRPMLPGRCQTLINDSSHNMQVFGYLPNAETINSIASSTGVPQNAQTTEIYCAINTGVAFAITPYLSGSYNHSGTVHTLGHTVYDVGTLSGGSLAITLAGAAPFTSSSTYTCFANDQTSTATLATISNTSGAAFTIHGTGTDVVSYFCAGS